MGGGPRGERLGGNPVMDEREKSDGRVLPVKLPNNAARRPRRWWREGACRGERGRRNAPRTQSRARRAKCAWSRTPGRKQDKEARFTALLHHVDVDRLRAAYRALTRRPRPGWTGSRGRSTGWISRRIFAICTPGFTAAAYRAKPSRQGVHTEARWAATAARDRGVGGQDPSAGGGRGAERHLRDGLPGFFLRVSAGAQPASRVGCARCRDRAEEGELDSGRGLSRLLRAHRSSWMVRFVEHRIADRRVLRLIQKWMGAGVIENGAWSTRWRGRRKAVYAQLRINRHMSSAGLCAASARGPGRRGWQAEGCA